MSIDYDRIRKILKILFVSMGSAADSPTVYQENVPDTSGQAYYVVYACPFFMNKQ